MLTGDIRSKIDALWNAFWTGGISNPLEVIEQIPTCFSSSASTTCTRWRKTKPPA